MCASPGTRLPVLLSLTWRLRRVPRPLGLLALLMVLGWYHRCPHHAQTAASKAAQRTTLSCKAHRGSGDVPCKQPQELPQSSHWLGQNLWPFLSDTWSKRNETTMIIIHKSIFSLRG